MSRRSELFRQIDKDISQAKHLMEKPDFNSGLADRAYRRMMRVDQMPPDIRRCVHEYGLEIVQEFLNHGVRKASSISHLIDTVRGAPQADGNPRFKINKGPNAKRNPADEEDKYYAVPKR